MEIRRAYRDPHGIADGAVSRSADGDVIADSVSADRIDKGGCYGQDEQGGESKTVKNLPGQRGVWFPKEHKIPSFLTGDY
jgi:hypothetical protein